MLPLVKRNILSTARNLGINSYVQRGSRYESIVKETLEACSMKLELVGGAGDGGIDLRGIWNLEPEKLASQLMIPVLIQCKRITRQCMPAYLRDLEGACLASATSPIGILVSTSDASIAFKEHLAQSLLPLGFANISIESEGHLESKDGSTNKGYFCSILFNRQVYKRLPLLAVGRRRGPLSSVSSVLYYDGVELCRKANKRE